MSTVAEIEAALPELSAEELRRVEALLHRLQSQPSSERKNNPRIDALNALQVRLGLDEQKTAAWEAVARDSRR